MRSRVRRFEPLEFRRLLSVSSVQVPVFAFSQTNSQVPSGMGAWSARLNDDSFPDLVTAYHDFDGANARLEVLLGDGQGRFTPHRAYPILGRARHVSFGDINNDGQTDWLAQTENHFQVFLRSENGWNASEQVATLGSMDQDTTAATKLVDVDNDGNLDLISYWKSGTVEVRIGFGDGIFGDSTAYPVGVAFSNRTKVPLAGDINGDGFVDVIRKNGKKTDLLINDGTGKFSNAPSPKINGEPSALIDIDRDGNLDVISASVSEGDFHLKMIAGIYLGRGDATFAMVDRVVAQAFSLSTGDFNGDGQTDLMLNRRKIVHSTIDTNGIELALGNPDGSFQKPFRVINQLPYLLGGPVAIDSDANGKDEILTHDSDNNLTVLELTEPTLFASSATAYELPGYSDIALDYDHLMMDIDADGFLDVLSIRSVERRPRVVVNRGTHKGFGASEILDVRLGNGIYFGFELTDSDGDGKAEFSTREYSRDEFSSLTASNEGASFDVGLNSDFYVVNRSDQSIGYVVGQVVDLPRWRRTAFGDFDLDGDIDAVLSDTAGFVVLLGIGKGDLNQDGKRNGKDVQTIRGASSELAGYDLNADNAIDERDVQHLVEDIAGTRLGDADFDGRVDFRDFLALANNFGNQDAVWDEGDFDGDGHVGFRDFLLLAENFGFDRETGRGKG